MGWFTQSFLNCYRNFSKITTFNNSNIFNINVIKSSANLIISFTDLHKYLTFVSNVHFSRFIRYMRVCVCVEGRGGHCAFLSPSVALIHICEQTCLGGWSTPHLVDQQVLPDAEARRSVNTRPLGTCRASGRLSRPPVDTCRSGQL